MNRGACLPPFSLRLHRGGQTLTDIIIALAVVSIGALGFIKAFGTLTRGLHNSRLNTIAVNLAQEKIESLKNLSYYSLLVTTATMTNGNLNITYDSSNYAPETFSYWGQTTLTRAVIVSYAAPVNGKVQALPYTDNDPGLKMITVYVFWNDNGTWKKTSFTNMRENPDIATLNASISGHVYVSPGNTALPDAVVSVLGSPQWNATTDVNGKYSLSVSSGDYMVGASSYGYYGASAGPLAVPSAGSVAQDLYLSAIGSGTVAALSVYFSSHILVSQVVADTLTWVADGTWQDVQYVELFNPTTFPVQIGSAVGCVPGTASADLQLNFTCGPNCSSKSLSNIPLCYSTPTVQAGSFYLIANTSFSFIVAATSVTPDAYFANAYYPAYSWTNTEIIQANHAGAVYVTNAADNGIIDGVGWSHTANSVNTAPMPGTIGTGIPQRNGLATGDQIVRMSSPCAEVAGFGRAYDTQDNYNNFLYDPTSPGSFFYSPAYGTLSGWFSNLSGFPAIGGFASSDDGLSSPAVISSATSFNPLNGGGASQGCYYGYFDIPNVATGAWMVTVASEALEEVISSVSVPVPGSMVLVLSTSTSPAIFTSTGLVPMTESAVGGYVAGTIENAAGVPLNGITVTGPGGSALTGPSGLYFLALDTGTGQTVTANPAQADPIYVSQAQSLDVLLGEVTTQNFELSQGGGIMGYATTGLAALPGVVFVASSAAGGSATGTTDATGHFYITNLATGTYSVTPSLNSYESSNPTQVSNVSLTVAGSSEFSSSFTISGVLGTFAGVVSAGGSAITTGALIIASTATLSYPPPIIYGSSATGQAYFYATASKPDGTYALPVRGSSTAQSYTYNLLAVYSTVNPATGAVVIVSQSMNGQTVNEGATAPVNFTGL